MEKMLYIKHKITHGLASMDIFYIQSPVKKYLIEKIHFSELLKGGILYSCCFQTGLPLTMQLQVTDTGQMYGYFNLPEKGKSTLVFAFRSIEGLSQLWVWYFYSEVLTPAQFEEKILPENSMRFTKN